MAAIDPAAQTKPGHVANGSKLGKRIALFQALRELECARLEALDEEDYEAARHVEEEIDQVRSAIQRPAPQPAAALASVGSSGEAAAHADPALTPTAAEGAMEGEATDLLPLSQEPPPSPELPWAELVSARTSLHSAFGGASAVSSGKESFAPDPAFFHDPSTFGMGDAGLWNDSRTSAEGDPMAEIMESPAAEAWDRPASVGNASSVPSLFLRAEVQITADAGAAESCSIAAVDSMEEREEEDTLKEEGSTQLPEPVLEESQHASQQDSILLGPSLETAAGEQPEQYHSTEALNARTPPRTEAALDRGFRIHKTPGGTFAKVSPQRATPRQLLSQQASPRQVSPREAAWQQPSAGRQQLMRKEKTFSFGAATDTPRAAIEEEAEALYPLFGEHLTRRVYSDQCDIRSAALRQLAVDVRSPAAENHLSAESVAGGVAKVLMHTFPDRDAQVFLSSAKLLQAACERLAHRQPFDQTSAAGPQCASECTRATAQRLRAW
jgi:hypothetical protein